MDSALKCVVHFLNTLYVPIWCNDNDVSFFFFIYPPPKNIKLVFQYFVDGILINRKKMAGSYVDSLYFLVTVYHTGGQNILEDLIDLAALIRIICLVNR